MLVKLIFKQVIDNQGNTEFEKAVWQDAYEEFCLQSQRYHHDGQIHTLQEMIANDPKANSLHYKVAFAVGLYTQGLKGKVPGWYDSLEITQMPFEQLELRLLSADTRSKKDFKLALLYTTPPMLLHGAPGNHYWVSHQEKETEGGWQPSMLISLAPNVSIGFTRQV